MKKSIFLHPNKKPLKLPSLSLRPYLTKINPNQIKNQPIKRKKIQKTKRKHSLIKSRKKTIRGKKKNKTKRSLPKHNLRMTLRKQNLLKVSLSLVNKTKDSRLAKIKSRINQIPKINKISSLLVN